MFCPLVYFTVLYFYFVYFVVFFFFFKQKTAYEMRISDWSSDVCSSDLAIDARRARLWRAAGGGLREQIVAQRLKACRVQEVHKLDLADLARLGVAVDHPRHRAVLPDGERLRAFGDVDVGLKRIGVVRHAQPFGALGRPSCRRTGVMMV